MTLCIYIIIKLHTKLQKFQQHPNPEFWLLNLELNVQTFYVDKMIRRYHAVLFGVLICKFTFLIQFHAAVSATSTTCI